MTFRKLTELQEKSRNAAHTSAFTHIEETNGRRWIAAREGLRPEMDEKRWIAAGYGSRPDMDG